MPQRASGVVVVLLPNGLRWASLFLGCYGVDADGGDNAFEVLEKPGEGFE